MNKSFFSFLIIILISALAYGLFTNLGNIAFWEDEGETVQLGITILKYGYPTAFDGRSLFIQEPGHYHATNYARYGNPLLQFYWAALALKLNGGIADTEAIRTPFVIIAFIGIIFSVVVSRRLNFSRFTVFLYLFLIVTSVQFYFYFRQVRHYALQPLLVFGIIITYLFLHRPKAKPLFILFSVLMYLTHYPGFFGIYAGLVIHLIISLILKQNYRFRPFIISGFFVSIFTLPVFIYFHHYEQVPGDNFISNLIAYFYDYNYHAYTKILAFSITVILLKNYRKVKLFLSQLVSSNLQLINRLWSAKDFSISLLLTLIVVYTLVLSTGRHNARYISDMYPLVFLLVAYTWDQMINKLKLEKWRWFSLIGFVWLMSLSHPQLLSQIKAFYQELNSIYLGPIEGIVNTITQSPPGPINAYQSQRPDLLIATGFEEHALYAYLGSQFLNVRTDNEVYKYGNRLPDWLIPRLGEEHPEYFKVFLDNGRYQKIVTPYCNLRYQQTYLVRTHQFKTATDCPDHQLTLYKLLD